MNIVLIGFMGSGKTMIANALGQKLQRPVLSTDKIIEDSQKRSINAIFTESGEEVFRRIEHDVIKDVSQKDNVIIDCGGGVVLNPDNLLLLKKKGKVYFIHATPDVIYQRLKNDTSRPLLQVPQPLERIKELYQHRLPLYNQADVVIDANDASIDGPVAAILQ